MRRSVIGLLVSGLLVSWSRLAAGQIPYHVFDERTQVSSIDFRFANTKSFSASRLQLEIVMQERGPWDGIWDRLRWLPFAPPPTPHPFAPLDLQRDVARLRRFYEISGFIGTRITYDVNYLNDQNEVDVAFNIDEGRPIKLTAVNVSLSGSADPASVLPPDLEPQWKKFAERSDTAIGKRYTNAEGARIGGEVLDWWMRRGYAFAKSTANTTIDSAAATLALNIELDPGPRARVDSLDVQGNASVSRGLILRTVPISRGDWFSSSRLADGQRRLFGLGLFRVALADVPKDQPRDSTAIIRLRLQESEPRLFTGEFGYVSAGGGLTSRAEFAHRNFTGGARSLRINGLAQTGWLTVGGRPEREYHLSLTYREPVLFRSGLSMSISPFVRYRDNLTDRSTERGLETTLIREFGPYRFLTLQHRYSSRRVFDYRIGTGSSIDLATLLRLAAQGALDTLTSKIQRSTLGVSTAIGRADPTRPRRAFQLRPSVEVTTPTSLNTIEYWQIELPMSAYYPMRGRTALVGLARLGRVFPFGKTVDNGTIGPLQRIQLRDVLLTAGGVGSVRGWGNGLLGPKQLNILFESVANGDSITPTGTDGYIPAGGLARAAASIELRLPFPGLGHLWASHIFFDAGRVWTADTRFPRDDPFNQERWFYGTGAGIDYRSIVGPIRMSIGYKLNPSPLDIRDAAAVFEALSKGLTLENAPTNWRKRFHIHLSLGQTF